MQTVFSKRLLAGLRAHNSEDGDGDDTFQDPDDSGPRLSVTLKESSVDEIYPAAAGQAAQTEQTNGSHPHTTDQSKAVQSPPIAPAETAGAPAPPDLLDPVVLRTMPPRVAAFMLYEPPEPPPWRAETLGGEQEHDSLEELGGWTGI
jgi:hypothetical protein